MATDLCRITVVGPNRRADLAVPVAVPVAELLPELVELVGERSPEALPRPWSIARLAQPPMPLSVSLAELGVIDGEVLYLHDGERLSAGPVVVDDLAEDLTDRTDAGPLWGPGSRALLLAIGAAAFLVGGQVALLLGVDRVVVAAGLCGLVALGTVTLALLRWRWGGSGPVPNALGLAGLPAWAGFAHRVVLLVAPGAATSAQLAGAAGGLIIGAGAAGLAVPDLVPVTAAVALAAVAVLLAAASVLFFDLEAVQVAALAAVLGVVVLALLPGVALRGAGVPELDGSAPLVEEVALRSGAARTLLAWLLAATTLVIVVAVGVLVGEEGNFPLLLAVTVTAVVALRARTFVRAMEVGLLASSALVSLVLIEAALLPDGGGDDRRLLGVALLVGTATALFVAASRADRPAPPAIRTTLERLATLLHVALVPLCMGALGVFDAVADWARGLV